MLARAVARSIRTQPALRNRPPTIGFCQSRLYAKSHRPSRPPAPKPHSQPFPNPRDATASGLGKISQNVRPAQSNDRITNASNLEARLQNINREISQDLSSSPSDIPEIDPSKPPQPLPDLTQGIPSTIDAELDGNSKERAGGLDITEDPEAGEQRGRENPKTAYIPSVERKKRRLARVLFAGAFGGALAASVWYGRNWESAAEERRHPDAPSGWGLDLFYKRILARTTVTLDHYTKPAFEKLLPDMTPEFERPYTLVVGLEDLLVHGGWTREHGWRVAKRPGVDYFLRYLSSYYEIVIWSTTSMSFAQPVLQKLDPFRVALWPLFREATRYENGECIKVGSKRSRV